MTDETHRRDRMSASGRSQTRIVLAFASVYLLWGSTYLFIRYAVETIPPFVMGSARFLTAGILLYAIARARGGERPTARHWGTAALTGVLMIAFGNGAVIWSEQTIASGIVALVVATVPVWMVLIDWLRPRGVRPRAMVFAGLALGLAGIVILIGPASLAGGGHGSISLSGAGILVLGSVSWAIGSIVTRRGARPRSGLVLTAMQMIAGGAGFLVLATISGEFPAFVPADVSGKSLFGVVYLVIAGSLLGFTAYVYLLGAVSAAKASTYAYVNPVIAVILGWAFAGEPIGARTIVAAAVILAGVAIITMTQGSDAPTTGEHPVPGAVPNRERTAA